MKNIITLIFGFLISALLVNSYFVRAEKNLIWFTNYNLKPIADTLIIELKNSFMHGLNPADYHVYEIEKLRLQVSTSKEESAPQKVIIKKLDDLLTASFAKYANQLYAGRLHSTFNNIYIKQHTSQINPADSLEKVLQTGGMQKMLQSFVCLHSQYHLLKKELMNNINIKQNGGWSVIPKSVKLKPGDKNRIIPLIRNSLMITGELITRKLITDSVYNSDMEVAVNEFKYKHNLTADGIIDASFINEMNVTVDERINQIAMNMERWRWLPRKLEDSYLMANIAGLNLKVMEQNKEVMSMKIIAGKYKTKTPLFHAHMSHIIINPWWDVPSSIARKEIVYDIRKNPSYLQQNHMKVYANHKEINPYAVNWSNYNRNNFPFQVRQTPGPWNSLGHIKFVFPNGYDVYFHDTPFRNLFSRQIRTFSHGCIRIEKPVELAAYLLNKDTSWVNKMISTDSKIYQEKLFKLQTLQEVYICYWTAWVDEQNRLCFANDIYNYDK